MDIKWSKLQNGTDIRGVALEGVHGENVNLTGEVVEKIGYSFMVWLSNKIGKSAKDIKIAVGNDSRLSGPELKKALIKGLSSEESVVFDCGLASTPAMFMTTVVDGYNFDGAIMITASHLPFNRNGLKFFTKEGGLEKVDIKEILTIAEEYNYTYEERNIESQEIDFISVYSDIFVKKIRKEVNSKNNWEKPLEGLKIIVDAGNGAGGFFASKVLEPLGADITGSQFLNPDGRFPNHIPNPEVKEAMESIQEAVKSNKADFGIIFDTDVDRAAVVDGNGNAINRNSLIALISAIILEEHPNSTIVTDSVTSNGLKKFIENDLKGVHHRFKRGYKNVINEAIRLNNEGTESHLAIETSGHAAIKENYFLDDGAYLTAKILIKLAKMKLEKNKNITELISALETPLVSNEYRVKINTEEFGNYGSGVLEDLTKFAKQKKGWSIVPNNFEGVRIDLDKENGDGWFLVRMSLHDPVIPINIESYSEGGVEIAAKSLEKFLNRYDLLDLSCFSK
ncbi:phosphoglucomutase [Clostridium sediminicola]|uniref:phosphomannomutase/phosphoglucomutase n=1 Tax=Clostridium sediminicola TaxID=3114879 RepID=UPI0031F1D218